MEDRRSSTLILSALVASAVFIAAAQESSDHLPNIPRTIEPADFQLKVHGHVRQPLSLTLHDLVHDFPSFACWRTGKTRQSRLRRSVALPMPTHYAALLRATWA
jgi:hypothetical protein